MDYWKRVIDEVLHKDDKDYPILFTNIRGRKPHAKSESHRREYQIKKIPDKAYFLGEPFEGVYLTEREMQVVRFLLVGKTFKQAGKRLKISHRTVEYYVKNMKAKLGARSKDELLRVLGRLEIFEK